MAEVELSFLALGDSYTAGEGVVAEERWPVLLAERLRAEGVPVLDPVVVARTGWTTRELAQGIREAGIQGTFSVVSLLVGVNNQYRGGSLEEYRTELSDLLREAVALAGGEPERVVVLSIPDWGLTPFAEGRDRGQIAREIDAFNRVARVESEEAGTTFVDLTFLSREAGDEPGLLAADGLHPSGVMYRRWAEVALGAFRSIVGFSRTGWGRI